MNKQEKEYVEYLRKCQKCRMEGDKWLLIAGAVLLTVLVIFIPFILSLAAIPAVISFFIVYFLKAFPCMTKENTLNQEYRNRVRLE